jgi:hypothetical protein
MRAAPIQSHDRKGVLSREGHKITRSETWSEKMGFRQTNEMRLRLR